MEPNIVKLTILGIFWTNICVPKLNSCKLNSFGAIEKDLPNFIDILRSEQVKSKKARFDALNCTSIYFLVFDD